MGKFQSPQLNREPADSSMILRKIASSPTPPWVKTPGGESAASLNLELLPSDLIPNLIPNLAYNGEMRISHQRVFDSPVDLP